MSAAWGSDSIEALDEKKQKRFIRLWAYLSVAGAFLMFVAMRLHINLF